MKNDQYGKPVPTDLVLLNLHDLELDIENTKGAIRKIVDLDWYEAKTTPRNNNIFVSAAQLDKIFEDNLIDFYGPEYLNYQNCNFLKIDSVLKRWNETDGFYHN